MPLQAREAQLGSSLQELDGFLVASKFWGVVCVGEAQNGCQRPRWNWQKHFALAGLPKGQHASKVARAGCEEHPIRFEALAISNEDDVAWWQLALAAYWTPRRAWIGSSSSSCPETGEVGGKTLGSLLKRRRLELYDLSREEAVCTWLDPGHACTEHQCLIHELGAKVLIKETEVLADSPVLNLTAAKDHNEG